VSKSGAESIILQNRLAYSRIAGEWARRQATDYDHGFHERCRAEFLKHLAGKRVLDMGCGLGLDSLVFARAGYRVVAADIASEFLPIVATRDSTIAAVTADMTMPCFRAGAFDGIYAVASFLHVPVQLADRTLAGFAQMLAPGGVLFLHHVQAADGRAGYQVDDLLIRDNPALCFCHAPEDLTSMLAPQGMRTVAVTDLRPSRYAYESAARNGLMPYQLIAKKSEVCG
jgi:cyclopropane fatty-acyl-phospholipid synthase-like methyltransferase